MNNERNAAIGNVAYQRNDGRPAMSGGSAYAAYLTQKHLYGPITAGFNVYFAGLLSIALRSIRLYHNSRSYAHRRCNTKSSQTTSAKPLRRSFQNKVAGNFFSFGDLDQLIWTLFRRSSITSATWSSANNLLLGSLSPYSPSWRLRSFRAIITLVSSQLQCVTSFSRPSLSSRLRHCCLLDI